MSGCERKTELSKKESKRTTFKRVSDVCRECLRICRTETWSEMGGVAWSSVSIHSTYLEILGRVTGELENLGGEVFCGFNGGRGFRLRERVGL